MKPSLFSIKEQPVKWQLFALILFGLLFISTPFFAQTTGYSTINLTLPQIALVDIESASGTAITLTLGNSGEAGMPPAYTGAINNNNWLNYTSAVPVNKTRKITAELTGGALPPGIGLKLNVGAYAGSGQGLRGSATGQISLTNTPAIIITGIGGAYTGEGPGNGHQLTYTLEIVDIEDLTIGTTNLSVLFTLSDAI